MILISFASIYSSEAGVFPSDKTGILDTNAYSFGAIVVPYTCLHDPFDPITFWIHGL
jgi:hypothetical protein